MQNIRRIRHQKHRCQIPQYRGAVFRYHRCNQAKNANRAQLDDCIHYIHGNRTCALYKFRKRPSFFANRNRAKPKEQRNHDNLQHICVYHRLQCVIRENIHDGFDKARCLRRLIFQSRCRKLMEKSLAKVRNHQTNQHCHRRCTHIIANGFHPDTANLPHVLHGNHTAHNREQHNRHYNEFH